MGPWLAPRAVPQLHAAQREAPIPAPGGMGLGAGITLGGGPTPGGYSGHMAPKTPPVTIAYSTPSAACLSVVDHLRLYHTELGSPPRA